MDRGWDLIQPPLCREIRQSLKKLKFKRMTPVQVRKPENPHHNKFSPFLPSGRDDPVVLAPEGRGGGGGDGQRQDARIRHPHPRNPLREWNLQI